MDRDEFIRPFRTVTKGNRIVEYFRVSIPEDVFETLLGRVDHAIFVAREQASIWRIPCNWYAYRVEGETVYVRRESHKT